MRRPVSRLVFWLVLAGALVGAPKVPAGFPASVVWYPGRCGLVSRCRIRNPESVGPLSRLASAGVQAGVPKVAAGVRARVPKVSGGVPARVPKVAAVVPAGVPNAPPLEVAGPGWCPEDSGRCRGRCPG